MNRILLGILLAESGWLGRKRQPFYRLGRSRFLWTFYGLGYLAKVEEF